MSIYLVNSFLRKYPVSIQNDKFDSAKEFLHSFIQYYEANLDSEDERKDILDYLQLLEDRVTSLERKYLASGGGGHERRRN